MELSGLYREVVETSPDGIWVFDLDGQNIVVEARQEGSPKATTVTQLDQVRQLVRFGAP